MTPGSKSIFQLHLAVFLFGFTGILGKLILLPALILVWWRSLLSFVLMIPNLRSEHFFKGLERKHILTYLGIGFLVGLHWIFFYGSIKLSNSSIAMICLAFIPVFTIFFEALFLKAPINRLDVITGCITLPAMYMIIQNIDFSYRLGFVAGIFSALFSACFVALNKKYILHASPLQISWIEMFGVWLLMTLLLPFVYHFIPDAKFLPSLSDLAYLVLLSYVCTVVSYVLALKALKHISAFSAMLIFNMEPVYGIILAIFLLREHKELNGMFYVGVVIILATVFIHPLLKKYIKGNMPMD